MTADWQAEDPFFDLIRNKGLISAILKQVAGKKVADANLTATGKVMKNIIRDCLTGSNGRKRVENGLPKYFRFPLRPTFAMTGLANAGTGKRWRLI